MIASLLGGRGLSAICLRVSGLSWVMDEVPD